MSRKPPTVDPFGGSQRIVVVGDLMVDQYVRGDVRRISQEAPVPVIEVATESTGLGGAANVAHQLVVLGAEVALCGLIGDDEAGRLLAKAAIEAEIDTAAVVVDASRPTTRKLRVVSGGQQVARVDWEQTEVAADEVVGHLVEVFDRLGRPDAVILSDYAKGAIHPELVAHVVGRCRDWGVPCMVDPRAASFDRYAGASLIKANRREFDAACRASSVPIAADLEATASALLRAVPVEAFVVTLGSAGMIVVTDEAVETIPAIEADVADVAGAGDTSIAVLALGLTGGMPLTDAARLANAAAGAAVRRAGVAVVTADEIRSSGSVRVPAVSASDPTDIEAAVVGWRAAGKQIVMTNGCFDLLHPGHVHLLTTAAGFGDVLIVAVNSDRSVRVLKGDDRPRLGQADRVAMLRALSYVDAVVVFDEDTPARVIETITPDVLVKGDDYNADEIVGSAYVRATSGRVEIVPRLPGQSTSALFRQGNPRTTSVSDDR